MCKLHDESYLLVKGINRTCETIDLQFLFFIFFGIFFISLVLYIFKITEVIPVELIKAYRTEFYKAYIVITKISLLVALVMGAIWYRVHSLDNPANFAITEHVSFFNIWTAFKCYTDAEKISYAHDILSTLSSNLLSSVNKALISLSPEQLTHIKQLDTLKEIKSFVEEFYREEYQRLLELQLHKEELRLQREQFWRETLSFSGYKNWVFEHKIVFSFLYFIGWCVGCELCD